TVRALTLEPAEGAEEFVDGGDRINLGEERFQRLGAQLLDALLVEKARVEVAELSLLRAGLCRLRLDDDVANGLLGLLGQNVERAVARLVVGDRRSRDPLAVHMTKQVVLRADVGVEFRKVDSGAEWHIPGRVVLSVRGSVRTHGPSLNARRRPPPSDRSRDLHDRTLSAPLARGGRGAILS